MNPFLKQTAKHLYEKHGRKISEIEVVLPTRRACVYFRHYLAEVANETILAPDIMAMDDYMKRMADVEWLDEVSLLFELYRSYRVFDKSPEGNLEQFAPLGMAMLQDFSMIDKNINPKQSREFFEYLDELKAIERWAKETLGEIEAKEGGSMKNFFSFWKHLEGTFFHFRNKLLKKNQAYSGLAYRQVMENLEDYLEREEVKQVAFVGFNQMSRAEENILEKLIKVGKAETYWDVDKYYLNNTQHEAGDFIRKYSRLWLPKPLNFVREDFKKKSREVNIVKVGNAVAQAKVAGDQLWKILQEVKKSDADFSKLKKSVNHTAILLPDESMLLPVLHSLPLDQVKKELGLDLGSLINITMGLSIYNSPLFRLIEAVFRLQENVSKAKLEDVGLVQSPKSKVRSEEEKREKSGSRHRQEEGEEEQKAKTDNTVPVRTSVLTELESHIRVGSDSRKMPQTPNNNSDPTEKPSRYDLVEQVYYKDLLRVLQHPLIQAYHSEVELAELQEFINQIQKENQIYVPLAQLRGRGELYDLLFTLWEENVENAIQYFYELVGLLSKIPEDRTDNFQLEFLFQFYVLLQKLETSLYNQDDLTEVVLSVAELKKIAKSKQLALFPNPHKKKESVEEKDAEQSNQNKGENSEKNTEENLRKIQVGIRTFKQFLFETLRKSSVPFTGEPLSPIQIMGMLEGRALDFENIILLSCNEGTIPPGKLLDSILPFDLRRQYDLPTHKESDSSVAYVFYRMFQEASKLWLIYTDVSGSLSNKEKSRFLLQVEEEFTKDNGFENTEINHFQLNMDLPNKQEHKHDVEKDDYVLGRTKAQLGKGVSPSGVNSYIKSPLEFFQRYIMKLREADLVEEDMARNTFGTLVHETLDKLFKDDLGRIVSEQDLVEIIENPKKVQDTMEEVISENFGGIVTDRGKNYLLKKVAERLIGSFLEIQKETEAGYYLIDQENYMGHSFEVELKNGEKIPFRISGKADRIDRIEEQHGNYQIRVVDYKTGGFHATDLKAKTWQELLTEPKKGKIVQLLVYKYLLIKTLQKNELPKLPKDFDWRQAEIKSGFFFFKALDSGFIEYKLEDETELGLEPFCKYVENVLSEWVRDVMDSEQAFTMEVSEWKGLGVEV
jgi:hypothetical protein